MPNMRWHLTLMAPRTRTNLAPNSSFNRALIRSAMVRKSKNYVVGVGHVDEFHALDFFGPFGLGFMLGAEVAIDDRHMAERLCVVMNSGGVVGRIHQIVEIGDAGAGHGHQGNGDLTVVDGSRGQHAGDRDLAAGDVEMEFVAVPGFLVALAVFLAADIARGGQLGEHLIEVLVGLPFEPGRLGLWPLLVLARAPALARRRGALRRRRIVVLVVRLLLDRFLARLDFGGVARDHADDAAAERTRDQRRVHLVGQIAPRELKRKRGKTWLSRALASAAPNRGCDAATCRRRGASIRALVVGTPSIALATKALARARRSSGGRPG